MSDKFETTLQHEVSRRDVLKLGSAGLLALGLAYSKPMVETVHACGGGAFDAYGKKDDNNDYHDGHHDEDGKDDEGGKDCIKVYQRKYVTGRWHKKKKDAEKDVDDKIKKIAWQKCGKDDPEVKADKIGYEKKKIRGQWMWRCKRKNVSFYACKKKR